MAPHTPTFAAAQRRVLVLTWIAYVAFNVARKITSVVKRRLQVDLSLSAYELGALDTAFLTAYTLGQFVNGPLGDRVGARVMVVGGLVGSGVCTYLSGGAQGGGYLVGLSFLHGLFQSGAWSACVKSLGPWLSSAERGTKMGLWSTCSPVGGVAGTAVATALLGASGWRGAFTVPGPCLLLVAALCYALLVDSPAALGLASAGDAEEKEKKKKGAGGAAATDSAAEEGGAGGAAGGAGAAGASAQPKPKPTLAQVLALPGMLWLCLGYFFLKFMRYLLLFWLPFYHVVQLGYDELTAGYLATTFELGGVFGTIAIGWVSDELMGGRRTLATVWMLLGAAAALVLYMAVGATSTLVSGPLMAVIGVLLLGPDSVLSSTICQDVGQRSPYGNAIVGTVTGIVNGCGSLGSILQGFVTAWVSARFGWDAVFGMLVAFSLITALALLPAVWTEAAATGGGGGGGAGGGMGMGMHRVGRRAKTLLLLGLLAVAGLMSLRGDSHKLAVNIGGAAATSSSSAGAGGGLGGLGGLAPPFASRAFGAAAAAGSANRWPACCKSVYDLPALLHENRPAQLAPGHRLVRRIFDARLSTAHIVLPPGMAAKLRARGADVGAYKTQSAVNVINQLLPQETMSHNAVRRHRFGLEAGGTRALVKAAIDAAACAPPDFCDVRQFVASDRDIGYVETERAILAANMGVYTGSHGLVIARRTKNVMELDALDFEQMLALAATYFARSHALHPARRFPVANFDTLASGGASQSHPHFQVTLSAHWYPGKWEAVRRAAGRYAADTAAAGMLDRATREASSGNYFSDLAAAHASIGLAFDLAGGAAAPGPPAGPVGFVSLTSAAGMELQLVARDATPARVQAMARLLHGVLQACYERLDWGSISLSCAFPALGGGSGGGLPLMCRLVSRGEMVLKGGKARVSDISSNELLAQAVVGSDVFETAAIIRKYLREQNTDTRRAPQKQLTEIKEHVGTKKAVTSAKTPA